MTKAAAEEAALGTRVARASASLLLRQIVVFGLGLVGNVVLARRLEPAVFGAYVVATAVFAFFTIAGDLGLAASLVQQPSDPTRKEKRSVFTAQLVVGVSIALPLALVGPAVAHAAGAPHGVDALIRFVALALLMSLCRGVATATLERDLRFGVLGAINAGEALVFNGTAVMLAYLGWGVRSFGIALVAEALVGLVLTNVAASSIPLPTLRPIGIRRRLAFGVPLLASGLVSVVKDAVSPLFIGFVSGARDVGLVEWAVTFAAYPLLAVMLLQRVFLPAFARLQGDRARLGRAVEGVILATNLVAQPLAVVTLVFASDLTPAVFGSRWVDGLGVFYLLWLANIAVPTAAPLSGLLNAVGETRTVLRYSVFWAAATWLLTVPFVLGVGRIGFGLANVAVQLSALPFIRAAQRQAPFRVVAVLWRTWACALVLAGALVIVKQLLHPTGIVPLAASALAGLLFYAGLVALSQKENLVMLVRTMRGVPAVAS